MFKRKNCEREGKAKDEDYISLFYSLSFILFSTMVRRSILFLFINNKFFFSSFLCFPTSVFCFLILFLNFCFLSDSILIGCTAYAAEARKHFIEVRERKIEREEKRIEIERIKIERIKIVRER